MIRTITYDAFLSYSRHDSRQVAVLNELLVEAGLSVWLDRERLTPNRSWRSEIETAMNDSSAAVIVWGPEGLGAIQRQERDLAYAIRDAHPNFGLINLILPGAPPPEGKWANIDTWVQFESGLDEPDVLRQLVAALRGEAPPIPRGGLPDEPRPYRGLGAFAVDDARLFFGRAGYQQEMLERLVHHPFLAVIGPSGSGKTSVVQAGLLAGLKRGVVPGSATSPQLVVRPGPRPLHALALTLARLRSASDPLSVAEDIFHRLQDSPLNVSEIIQSVVPPEQRLTLVVDRLEEIYTLCESEAERQPFVEALLALAQHPHHPAWIVVTMRADFYDRVGLHAALTTEVVTHQVYLRPMALEDVAEIIEAPAAEVGAVFEKGLALQVRMDSEAGGELVLPLLQHTLDLLWRKRRGRWLTWDAYREVGGVAGALRYHADRVIDGLASNERAIARRMLLRLIWVDESTGTVAGRRVDKTGLFDAPDDEKVLQWLADERLVVLRGEATRATVELIHDTLPLHWEMLHAWMLDQREFLLWRQRLRTSLEEWKLNGSEKSDLLGGKSLGDAQQWLAEHGDDLNPDEEAFIQASVDYREREREARERQRRRVTLALVVGLVTALGLAALALVQRETALTAQKAAVAAEQTAVTARETALAARDDARIQQQIAQSHELVAKAVALLPADPEHSIQFAVGALKLQDNEEAVDTLRVSLSASHIHKVLLGHGGAVTTVVFSPDGQRVLTASEDDTARIWATDSAAPIALLTGHTSNVNTAEFSPDGRRVVTASADKTARIWDSATGAVLWKLTGHTQNIPVARFNAQGTQVVTASHDSTARLWNAETGALEHEWKGHMARLTDARFSPDGRWVVTTSDDSTARVWDTHTTSAVAVAVLTGHTGNVTSVDFSPDGSRLVTTSRDKSARIWEVGTWKLLHELWGHVGQVNGATFSPSGKWVATRSDDWTTRVWDLSQLEGPPKTLFELRGHTGEMNSTAFSQDGAYLVTASKDKGARVWDAGGDRGPNEDRTLSELRGHTQEVTRAAFSPDGTLVATASKDGTARIWDATGGRSNARLEAAKPEAVTNAAFVIPDQHVLTWSQDKIPRLWNAESGQLVEALGNTSDQPVTAPDGRHIVTWTTGQSASVWDSQTGRVVAQIGSQVGSVAFSSDGQLVVTGSIDGQLSVWDTSTWQQGATLAANGRRVRGLKFSRDGRRVAAGSQNPTGIRNEGIVRVWEVGTTSTPVLQHPREVSDLAFSPDGRHVVTLAADGIVRVWNADGGLQMELTHSTPQRMRINRDGTRLVTLTTNDSSAHLWDLSAGRLVTDLPGAVSDVQFSEDGDYFVTATVDSTPRVWSAANGDRLLELVGGTSEVRKVAFSRDGLFIASGSEDGTIRVWNAHSGRNLLLLRAHSKRVNALSFSPDGRRIVSASEDKTAKVFACEVCVPRDELLRLAKDRSSVELESSQRSTTEPLGLPLRAPGGD